MPGRIPALSALALRRVGDDTPAVIPLRLPLLEEHRASLETCVYCPKLCRATCPVSNVEHSETVTPWGKMSLAYFAARGDVDTDRELGAPAWACTSCYACRERCDHRNEVAPTLTDARAELFERGVAPEAAVAVAERWPARAAEVRALADALDPERADASSEEQPAVLIGCTYLRREPEVARDALAVTRALVGGEPRVVRACCGLPLLHAGDRKGFVTMARALAAEVANAPRLVAVDPGCARALLVDYPRVGVEVRMPELLLDLAARSLDKLRPLEEPQGRVRYHDPCQLGRGLGRYDEPRAVIARITGQKPEGFLREREQAECSGGGGLLPATRPASSRAIADQRIEEHRARGGGVLVTACASSLHRFRSRGEAAEDIVSLIARALERRE